MRTAQIVACVALCAALVAAQKPLTAIQSQNVITGADKALADVQAVEKRYAALQARQDTLSADLDSYWLIFNAALVLLMQAGLALYEAGTVRSVNQASVFFKNVLVCAVVAITWWTIGYALAYGDNRRSSTRNGFIGNGDFILVSDGTNDLPERTYGRWFFEWTYALIPTTLVTMACAERLRVTGIIFVSIVISGFVYPVIAHWTWSNAGYLSPFAEAIGSMGKQGVFDFAGSGTIFLCGGTAGFAATIALESRKRRFDNAFAETFRTRNKLYLTFGALVILVTAIAYTTGRTLKLSGPMTSSGANVASKVLINTILAAVGGFLGGFPLYYLITPGENINVAALTDSIIAGIAAISSGVAVVEPWAALTIGAIGGLIYALLRGFIEARVDDTLNGFAMLALPGFWGLIATGLLATEYNTLRAYGNFGGRESLKFGLFYHGGGDMLWAQLVGAIAITAWSFAATFIIVKVTMALAGSFIRLDGEDEKFGADMAHYTEYAVTEAFAEGCDELSGKFSNGGGLAAQLQGQDVPRWLLVDFREQRAKEEEAKKKAQEPKKL
jgi:Amt family ammonium transporter